MRWFGIDRNKRSGSGDFRMEPDIPEYGFKFHMNDMNATIGLANLTHLPRILEACRSNARYYERAPHPAARRHAARAARQRALRARGGCTRSACRRRGARASSST